MLRWLRSLILFILFLWPRRASGIKWTFWFIKDDGSFNMGNSVSLDNTQKVLGSIVARDVSTGSHGGPISITGASFTRVEDGLPASAAVDATAGPDFTVRSLPGLSGTNTFSVSISGTDAAGSARSFPATLSVVVAPSVDPNQPGDITVDFTFLPPQPL